MRTLISSGTVIPVNESREVISTGYVVINGHDIEAIGPAGSEPAGPYDSVVDARGMIVVPGLINMHQHPWMNLLKGLADGIRLEPWVFKLIVPARARLTREDLDWSTLLSAMEMLRTGTTCLLNHHPTFEFEESERQVVDLYSSAGIRHVLAAPFQCRTEKLPAYPLTAAQAKERMVGAIEEFHGARDGIVQMALVVECNAHHTELGKSSDELVRTGYELAREKDLRIAVHMSGGSLSMNMGFTKYRRQTGRSDVEYLERLGVLDERWILKHGIHFSDIDIATVARRGAHVVYTPTSESIRGGGIGPWRNMVEAGVNCALGSDGPAVDYSVDMVEQMKAAVYMQSIRYRDGSALSPAYALEMATINAARALGLDDIIGSLEPGKRADIALFKATRPIQALAGSAVQSLVMASRGSDADTVFVNGRMVLRQGIPLSVPDGAGVVQEATRRARRIARESATDAGAQLRWPQRADEVRVGAVRA
ncbi:amidohydrolase family protein [Variovorax sp. Sphag1AA]|uniref:amidohydrolase family protein n=1 Tax=Variovorax sp. Sphag1AA TaxID=2587027 RepID=UPI00161B5CDE|nr:amidohydrolase family protein [Variovorax sp. Sphag1AA]MBB3181630.1 5-methylthioadenosine/S-adenosylhomocysteine deaminase [Variovorax sp. Sphag1AA]